jgi:type IV pilus assembly protein PilY1
MTRIKSKFAAALAGTTWMTLSAVPVLADDSEIFVSVETGVGVRPNVLFVVDTSGSMDTDVLVEKGPYDPNFTYTGTGCSASRVYFTVGGIASPPACTTVNYFNTSANHCKAARDAMAGVAGSWTGKAAQYDTSVNQWRDVRSGAASREVECEVDSSPAIQHGSNSAPTPNIYARDNNSAKWTSTAARAISWSTKPSYTLYSANWLNWYNGGSSMILISRLDIVKTVATQLASSINGINLGLMRFSNDGGSGDAAAEGGMVMHEVADIDTSRASIVAELNSWRPNGWTPLAETMYEATQYWRGAGVDYGETSHLDPSTPWPSVAASRKATDPKEYKSPIEFQCQKNVVILLTDGEPTQDNSADAKIRALPGYVAATGDAARTCGETGAGRCLDEVAGYLRNADLSSLDGRQSVLTYAIGFGTEAAGSPRLNRVAIAGGTGPTAYEAQNIADLTVALQAIFRDIFDTQTTFVTPSVAVNAFNRSQTINELFISVFAPKDTLRWPGNLKKYAIEDGAIVDSNGNGAVDPDTGFFRSGVQSFWSPSPDGNAVQLGGAASQLPAPNARNLYTHLESAGQARLAAPANRLSVLNLLVTDTLLQTTMVSPTREEVLNWAHGLAPDTADIDGDGDTTELIAGTKQMGDPMHGRVGLVAYAQTGRDTSSDEAKDVVVFVPTNDGFLHAINGWSDTAGGGGQELWSFVPEELLPRLTDLYRNPTTANRTYGLDGDVRVLKYDIDQDGVIEPADGDRAFIFFGMRRGGSFYYGLDVTDRDDPQLMWKLGPAELPGIGETWSPPTVARINVAGTSQNAQKFVLVFGGGYDAAQENPPYSTDAVGNRIYIVDALSGARLWFGGGAGVGTPNLLVAGMENGITGRINVLDINGDQFADRMYAADNGGRVFRFDIYNGRSAGSLVTGGVFAELGAAGLGSPTQADTRRFYYGPDVVLIQRRGEDPYYNLAIGSGYRGHPLNEETEDYFFSLRDRNPYGKLTQAEYGAVTPLVPGDLVDLTADIMGTAVAADAAGWRIGLVAAGDWAGEKVLAESTTVNGIVLFPTYQPAAPDEITDPCHPQSTNRVYAMTVDGGKPAINFSDDDAGDPDYDDPGAGLDEDDLYTTLAQKEGIVGEITVGILRKEDRTICIAGVEVLSKCVSGGNTVRTFWQRTGGT